MKGNGEYFWHIQRYRPQKQGVVVHKCLLSPCKYLFARWLGCSFQHKVESVSPPAYTWWALWLTLTNEMWWVSRYRSSKSTPQETLQLPLSPPWEPNAIQRSLSFLIIILREHGEPCQQPDVNGAILDHLVHYVSILLHSHEWPQMTPQEKSPSWSQLKFLIKRTGSKWLFQATKVFVLFSLKKKKKHILLILSKVLQINNKSLMHIVRNGNF